jgi:hypothetical protein
LQFYKEAQLFEISFSLIKLLLEKKEKLSYGGMFDNASDDAPDVLNIYLSYHLKKSSL